MGSHLEDGKEVFSTSRELGLEEDQPVALAQGDEVPQRRGGAEDGLEPVRLLGEGGGAQEELPEVGELLYGHCLVHVSCESVFTLTPSSVELLHRDVYTAQVLPCLRYY